MKRAHAYVASVMIGLSAASSFVPRAASAQTATAPDAVFLKDGAVIRGNISELREGSHVLVQLDGGQVARVRWDVIARIERSGAPVRPAPAAPAATAVAPAPAQALQDTVFVHIEAPDTVRLEQVSGRSARFICDSPCDMPVPLQGSYRIAGSIRATRQFTLSAKPGERVTLSVDPASKGAFAGGVVLVSLGGVSLLIGSLTYLVASAVRSATNDRDGKGGQTVGAVMMGLGVGGIAGGVVMMVANGSSKVDETVGGAPGAPPSRPAPQARAFEVPARRDAFTASVPAGSFITPLAISF